MIAPVVRFIPETPEAIVECLMRGSLVESHRHFWRQNRSKAFATPGSVGFALFPLPLLLASMHNGMPIRLLRTNKLRPNRLSSAMRPTARQPPSLPRPKILQQILLLSPIAVPRARHSYLDPSPSCRVELLLAQHYVSSRLLVPLIHAIISETIYERSAG